jgi:hypothetical protein
MSDPLPDPPRKVAGDPERILSKKHMIPPLAFQ